MAKKPELEDVIQAVLEKIATYYPRPGSAVPTMGVRMKLGTAFTAAELEAAFKEMVQRGWIEPEIGAFFKLTEVGVSKIGPLPSVEETIQAILAAAASYNSRPGDAIPVIGVQTKLGPAFTDEEFRTALAEMIQRGWAEAGRGPFFKLTDSGFDQL